jgi:hypothetical protein
MKRSKARVKEKEEWFYFSACVRVVWSTRIRDRWRCILDREYVRSENRSDQHQLDGGIRVIGVR